MGAKDGCLNIHLSILTGCTAVAAFMFSICDGVMGD